MRRITTKSGAVYLIDEGREDGLYIMRESGEMNPRMRLENNEWHPLVAIPQLEVGKSAFFLLENNLFRVSTEVVSIEDIPE